MSDEQGESIKKTDKRTFQSDEDGAISEEQAQATAAEFEKSGEECQKCLPPIDFSQFVLSLSTSALLHLGEIEHPDTGEKAVNIELARQTIDLLGMLQEKTRGNLDREEEKLLENLLYDLRMKYVALARSS